MLSILTHFDREMPREMPIEWHSAFMQKAWLLANDGTRIPTQCLTLLQITLQLV